MRDIKFRGKRKSDGEWLYGSLLISKFKDDKMEKYFITQFLGNYTFDHEVIPETVGQYTGMTDKVEQEIYEGDIVVSFKKPYEDKPTTNKVDFEGGCWRLTGVGPIPIFNYSPKHLELIGNIHDNEELLNT